MATASGVGMAAGAATEAALATLAAPAGGSAAVPAAGGGVMATGAVLAGVGVLAGAGSFLPQPLSSSRPARVALYNAVERMDRVMGTPVSMTWQMPIHGVKTPRLALPI
ncbi:hypothetical protein GCM10009121_03790 [Rhodanobacter soli]